MFRADSIFAHEVRVWGWIKSDLLSRDRGMHIPQQPLDKSRIMGKTYQTLDSPQFSLESKSSWTKNGNTSTISEHSGKFMKKTKFTYCHRSRQQIQGHSFLVSLSRRAECWQGRSAKKKVPRRTLVSRHGLEKGSYNYPQCPLGLNKAMPMTQTTFKSVLTKPSKF